MHAGTAARGSHGKRPRSRTEINQDIAGCQPKQVDHLVALRLEVAEISMSAIVNLDFRRIAVVSSHLLKLVVLPGCQISHHRGHILARSRPGERASSRTNREGSYLSTLNSHRATAAGDTAAYLTSPRKRRRYRVCVETSDHFLISSRLQPRQRFNLPRFNLSGRSVDSQSRPIPMRPPLTRRCATLRRSPER